MKTQANTVMDERTRESIFGRRSLDTVLDGLLDEALSGISLDDYIQNPLTDLKEINERLDTIGEFVEDKGLRERVAKIVNVLGYDYDAFYEALDNFVKAGESEDEYFRNKNAERLGGFIRYLANIVSELPDDFGKTKFKTRTLENLAKEYATLRNIKNKDGLEGFFSYILKLNEAIEQLESKQRETGDAETLGITYDQLAKFVDKDKLYRYMETLGGIKPLHDSLLPFLALANEAVEKNYTRPEVVVKEHNCLVIRQGRYDIMGGHKEVVPNDTVLEDRINVEVLEGVNNGGKTIDMKKALYIAVRALSGSWVPAGYAKVSVRDRIILREKGTGNAISAFQQDCKSVKEVMPDQGAYCLIGMDETFTSTEQRGGMALTYGLICSIIDQANSLMIISSHHPNLSESFVGNKHVRFVHFPFERRVSEKGRNKMKVVFPYKKQKGPLDDYRYGITVATSVGFDSKVIEYAEQRLLMKEKQSP